MNPPADMHVGVLLDRAKSAEETVEELQRKLDRPSKKLTALGLKEKADAILARYEVEPMEELIKIATGHHGEISIELQTKIWSDLLQYRMPKLKAVEMSGQVDTTLNVSIVQFDEHGNRRSSKIKPNTIDVEPLDPQEDPVKV